MELEPTTIRELAIMIQGLTEKVDLLIKREDGNSRDIESLKLWRSAIVGCIALLAFAIPVAISLAK